MAMWNPWRGCKKVQQGCLYCYIFEGDNKKHIDTTNIIKLSSFDAPIKTQKNGQYNIPSGRTVYLCFSSDFLLEEADKWRQECWDMMRKRQDLTFVFLTKRMHRLKDLQPMDWDIMFSHVQIGVSVSTQKEIDDQIPYLTASNVQHKTIVCQPLIEQVTLNDYLPFVDKVIVGGEHGKDARPLDMKWVLRIREECISHSVAFEFRQTGSYFIKENQQYHIPYRQQSLQAKKAQLNFKPQLGVEE